MWLCLFGYCVVLFSACLAYVELVWLFYAASLRLRITLCGLICDLVVGVV